MAEHLSGNRNKDSNNILTSALTRLLKVTLIVYDIPWCLQVGQATWGGRGWHHNAIVTVVTSFVTRHDPPPCVQIKLVSVPHCLHVRDYTSTILIQGIITNIIRPRIFAIPAKKRRILKANLKGQNIYYSAWFYREPVKFRYDDGWQTK